MPAILSVSGAVLAGGHSRRMGRDKATLVFEGKALWQHQLKLLADAGADPVGIVRRADQPALPLAAGTPLWYDNVADVGPLAGLHAALSACRTDLLAVVAVDLPQLDAGWFRDLLRRCRAGQGVMAQDAESQFEPLAAIYPRDALAEVTARLAGSDYSLQALAAALVQRGLLAATTLEPHDRARLKNWNRPEDVSSGASASAE